VAIRGLALGTARALGVMRTAFAAGAERARDGGVRGFMSAPYTILFVEDDVGVRESTTTILSAHGFRMLVARNADEALAYLEREHVDVLFTDVVMPGVNGIALAKQATARRPALKIMFMTAYYSRAAEAAALGKLMFKPVREAEMVAGLRELIALE